MMKKCLCLIFFFTLAISEMVFSQAPDWLWAEWAGGQEHEFPNSCVTDEDNNIFVSGRFSSPDLTIGSFTLSNVGNYDIFIAKYDPDGNVLWAYSYGGNGYDETRHIAVDNDGNVIIAGIFSSALLTFGSVTITNAGAADGFIAKFDSSGNVIWAESAGGIDDDGIISCTVDNNDNIIVSGYFNSSALTIGTTTVSNLGMQDIFISKYSPAGIPLWTRSVGGTQSDAIKDCDTDSNGNVIVCGSFSSAILSFNTILVSNSGTYPSSDVFLAKFDSGGNIIWAVSEGGSEVDEILSCSVDSSNNIFVTGYFISNSISFGSLVLNNSGSFPTSDMFTVKYDGSGNAIWVRSSGGTGNCSGRNCTVAANGSVVVTGVFHSSSIMFGSIVLTVNGDTDMYLCKYDSSGNVIWAVNEGGTGQDVDLCCAVDLDDNTIIAGYFYSPTISFGNNSITYQGALPYGDMFIAKMDASIPSGIIEQNNNIKVVAFPDPADDLIFIKSFYNNKCTVDIHNMLGNKVISSVFEKKEEDISINISELTPGIYFISLWNNNEQYVTKFVKN